MNHLFRDAWYLARTDTWRLLHSRETLMWTFIMPVVFFYFIGMVNNNGSDSEKDSLAVSAAPDAGFLADDLIPFLTKGGFDNFKQAILQKLLLEIG